MSPGERAALGRREPSRPQYGATAPGFPPHFYPPYGVPHPNAWLGAPLISMASRAPPSRHTPISKLAIHAQGAPLIIQNRYDRRKFATTQEQRNQWTAHHSDHTNRDRCEETPEGNRQRNQQQQARSTRGGRNNNTDAVSVASDESSGSNNSETMLPRIIKPRKRRKKDRKPNNIVHHDLSNGNLDIGDVDCGASGVGNNSGIYEESFCSEVSTPFRLDVKVIEYPDSLPETYRVSALGEALEATRFGLADAPVESAVSSCQCRYCDPVKQIWDAESRAGLLDENSSGDFPPTKLEDSMKVVGPLGRKASDVTLRRSWSDPSSRVPARKDVSNNEAFSAPNLYSLFPPARRSSSPQEPRSPLALEISSEIVTSINGHRDLEIKLFSTSPPAALHTDCNSVFADKSESAAKGCSVATFDRIVNSAVYSENVHKSAVKNSKHKSEDVYEAGCSSAFTAGGASGKLCDLALVTA